MHDFDRQTASVARNWRDLIRPRKLEVGSDSLTPTYGKFTCEPLERGFGTTLGNSLRRMLLSSLQGAAITAVKIEGALHEFTDHPRRRRGRDRHRAEPQGSAAQVRRRQAARRCASRRTARARSPPATSASPTASRS